MSIFHLLLVLESNRMSKLLGNANHCYGNCDFITGSAAEVECLWSFADTCLDGHRNKTAPIIFEAMIYSCYTREFWKTVVKALKIVKENRTSSRSTGMAAEDDLCAETMV